MSGYAVKRALIPERKAADAVEANHPEYKAAAAMKFGKGFVVFMSGKSGEELLDCMYGVSTDYKQIFEFNPDFCMEAFQKAQDNVVKF